MPKPVDIHGKSYPRPGNCWPGYMWTVFHVSGRGGRTKLPRPFEGTRDRVPGARQVNGELLAGHGVAITSCNGRLVSATPPSSALPAAILFRQPSQRAYVRPVSSPLPRFSSSLSPTSRLVVIGRRSGLTPLRKLKGGRMSR